MLATQDVCPSTTAHLTNEEWFGRLRENAHVISALMWSFAQDAAEFAKTDAWEEEVSEPGRRALNARDGTEWCTRETGRSFAAMTVG